MVVTFLYPAIQGMDKNRVESDRKFFKIPALLSCERGNSAENGMGIFKIYVIFNFLALDFLVYKIKEWEFQRNFCRSLPIFYKYIPCRYIIILPLERAQTGPSIKCFF